jgi:histidinol-phosphatase (PHP family)
MYKNIVDLHVHTDNSFDGNHSATFFCEKAEMLELKAVAFTDHCEVDQYKGDLQYEKRMFQAFFEVAKVASAFRGKILILNGIELGQPTYDIETAENIISHYDYDMILGSIHNLRNCEDFYFMKNLTMDEAKRLLKEYFIEIIEMIKWGKFDVLAHLTYPLRYFYSQSNLDINLDEFKDQIDEILNLIIEKNISLEINTAALRQPLNKLSPDIDILKRYKELGGKYVSVGSDAHYAEHLSADIDVAYSAALEAGFEYITFFEKRTPMMMKIQIEG